MKKKILLFIGICTVLSGCGVHSDTSSESYSITSEQESGILSAKDTEAVGVTDTTEEEPPDPEGTIRTTAEDLKKLPTEIQDIFFGDGQFYDIEEKKEFTGKTFQVTDTYDSSLVPIHWESFLVADIDQDGEEELAVCISPYYPEQSSIRSEVRIFDLSGGTVYAHPHSFRGVKDIYENGIIGGSSGASDNDWSRISYDGKEETRTVEAYTRMTTEEPGIAYYISDEETSEEKFDDYISRIFDKQDGHTGVSQILWSREDLEVAIMH